MLSRTAVSCLAAWCLFSATGATYQIDSNHSGVHFSVRHMMVSNVRGEFGKVAGTVTYDPAAAACQIDATIDAASINTRQAKRDEDLRGAEFFDTAKFPNIVFKGSRCEKVGGEMKVHGNLTMHGVTKPVVLALDGPSPEIKDANGTLRIGTTATTTIKRSEFGLTWNKLMESGGVVVSDEVQITLDLELTRKPAAVLPPAK